MLNATQVLAEASATSVWPILLGPLIGAVIALLGVWLTLAHDARQRRQEREWNQKNDVYLQAAESLAKIPEFLGSFARTDISHDEHFGMLGGNPGWGNKVHLVASMETLEALTETGDFQSKRTLELFEHRFRFDSLGIELQHVTERVKQLSAYSQQLVSTLQTLSEGLTPEHAQLFGNLVREHEQVQQQLQQKQSQENSLNDQRYEIQKQLVIESMKAVAECQDHLVKANLAIRRELKIPLEEEAYLDLMKASTERSKENFQTVFHRLERTIESDG